MYLEVEITRTEYVEVCDNCDRRYDKDPWKSGSTLTLQLPHLNLNEPTKNVHFHFCTDGCNRQWRLRHSMLGG